MTSLYELTRTDTNKDGERVMWKIQEGRDAERERERRIRWRETEMKRRMKEVIKEERKTQSEEIFTAAVLVLHHSENIFHHNNFIYIYIYDQNGTSLFLPTYDRDN